MLLIEHADDLGGRPSVSESTAYVSTRIVFMWEAVGSWPSASPCSTGVNLALA
jgi:hypothetical protein